MMDKKMQAMRNLAAIVEEGQKEGEFIPGDPFQLAATFMSATQGLASFKLMFGDQFELPDTETLMHILLK